MTIARTNYLARTTSFKEFLNEEVKFDVEKFLKDCAYFIDQTYTGNGDLWVFKHGLRNPPADFDIRQFKERTGPRDSPMSLHNTVNEFYKDKFGYPFRNAMFVTGKWTQAAMYGPVCALIPIGKFDWLGSWDVEDLTGDFEAKLDRVKHAQPESDYDERSELAVEMVMRDLKKAKFMHNTDLNNCISSQNEIMLKCGSYYLFDIDSPAYEEMRHALQKANDERNRDAI